MRANKLPRARENTRGTKLRLILVCIWLVKGMIKLSRQITEHIEEKPMQPGLIIVDSHFICFRVA